MNLPDASLEEIEESIRQDLAARLVDRALNRITSLGEDVYRDASLITSIFGSRTLDELCMEIGAQAGRPAPGPPQPSLVVYVATELAIPGGHTFVMRDLVAAQPGHRHVVLLSGSLGKADVSAARSFFTDGVQIEAAPTGSPGSVMRWLVARLSELRPGRAFLFAHPYDAPAVAAFQPELAEEMVFYHHVDHAFTLGTYLPHVIHASFRPAGYWNARHSLGIHNTRYLPLTAGALAPVSKAWQRPITTAASGYWQKFATNYDYEYVEEVSRWITATGGCHVHVGWLHPDLLAAIAGCVARAGIEPGRFVHVPESSSLRQTLIEHDVSVYIDSFPLAGCRSVLEAMSVGLPVITHHNESSELLSNETLVYPGARSWRHPDELVDMLAQLDPETLPDEGTWAAEYYAANHGPAVVQKVLASPLRDAPAPAYRPYTRSTLSLFLDRRARGGGAARHFTTRLFDSLRELGEIAYEDAGDDHLELRRRISQMLYSLAAFDPEGSDDLDIQRRADFVATLSGVVPRVLTPSGTLDQKNASKLLYSLATPQPKPPNPQPISAGQGRRRRGIRRNP